jgi:saccharopine dehydrogenase-like NADP-dependent oxidoreductase
LIDADLVLSLVGPYYRFGVPILRAAIETGTHYIDICDDWEPTLEMLELDEEARRAGVTAIVGMGASPGVSNLLAVKAMSHLDTVHDVVTGWGEGTEGTGTSDQPGEGGSYGAALEHWVHQFTGRIRLYRNAGFVDVPPLQPVLVNYPGAQAVTVHTVGHPEPVTLPRFHPEMRSSCNVMDFRPELIVILRWLAERVDAGRMSAREAGDWLLEVMSRKAFPWKDLLTSALGPKYVYAVLQSKLRGAGQRLPPLFAVATGLRGAQLTTVGATLTSAPAGGMGGATGIPMAVALAKFARGEIDRRGVFAPESLIDPDSFFDELAPMCVPTRMNASELLQVTVAG